MHGVGEILIGGGNDTGLEGNLLVAAQGNVFLGFQDTEQLDLHVHRHGSEFVQKERTFAGQFEFADLAVFAGTGESAALIAEQFGFQQFLRNGGTVQADKGLMTDQTGIVDGLGEELLAGTTFALDQNAGITAGNGLSEMLQVQHFLIVGDDIVEVILGSVHLGNLTPISLEVVFQLGHPAVQVGDFLDVTEDDGTGCTDDFMIVNQRDSIGDDHGAIDLLKLHQLLDTGLCHNVKPRVLNDFRDVASHSGRCLYIKEFLIVPFDDIAVFIDETHTIVFGIQNIGQRINTVRQFVEVFLMRHNVIQPLGNIDNAKR